MAKTNACNLEEEEILAEEVRKYPCLYDKSNAGYKERDRTKNAWRAIEEELGYEKGNKKELFFVTIFKMVYRIFVFKIPDSIFFPL